MRRSGHSLVEVLLAFGLVIGLLATAFMMYRGGVVSAQATLAPQMALQMATRKAFLDFIKELQECIEFVRPTQGSTLTYLLARDKLDRVLLTYMVEDPVATAREGRPLQNVFLYRQDNTMPAVARQRLLLGNVTRLSFTSLGSGLVQIRMDVYEQGHSYPMLTTVRARNIALEAEL